MGFISIKPLDSSELRCPYCLDRLDSVLAVQCSQCYTRVHSECWALNGGCPTFLCRGGLSLSSVPWNSWFPERIEPLRFPELAWAAGPRGGSALTAFWRTRRLRRAPESLSRCVCLVLRAQILTERFMRILTPKARRQWDERQPAYYDRVDVRLVPDSGRERECLVCRGEGVVVVQPDPNNPGMRSATCISCGGKGRLFLHLADQRTFSVSEQAFLVYPDLGEPATTLVVDTLGEAHPPDARQPTGEDETALCHAIEPRSLPSLPAGWSWYDAEQQITRHLAQFGDRYDLVKRRATAYAVPTIHARWANGRELVIIAGLRSPRVHWL
ncbi:MAG: hypothetical protein KC609_13410 [Myxococcales bacterium]|nr:hypothetical protein [Myxococcales bacterium]